ncbi:MAG: ribonuclease HII [Deferribacteraceae bacterium]|jgi:ribonuclease HII|nr:ribonuclease HII [Deferribacteraceae bacterium]
MIIAGVDEVGRGALAGPVVACAVILPPDYVNLEIKDSKKLSARKRERLAVEIQKNAIAIGIGVVCNILIDKIGIVPATKQAMHMAIIRLGTPCDKIIVDAVALNNLPCPHEHPYKADDLYPCVSAASIVGKVYRDALMVKLATVSPAYQWDKNKGYGSAAHIAAIKDVGLSPLHRRTFCSAFSAN